MASNFLVTSEKAIGSYSLMTAQYPFIGGTSATHSINLNAPSGSFNLTYPNGMGHSANGMQGNGTNQFANTFINGTTLNPNSIHFSFYSNTNRATAADQREMGFEINPYASPGNYAQLIIRRFSDQSASVLGLDANLALTTNTDSRGYYIANRSSSTYNNLLKNGIVTASSSVSNSQTYPNANVLLMAINFTSSGGVSPASYSTLQSGYISIGGGFTPTQEVLQTRIVTFYNSLLNRQ